MEYLAGSAITLLCVVIGYAYSQKAKQKLTWPVSTLNSQSRKFDLLSPIIQYTLSHIKSELITQATKYHDSFSTRVVLTETQAFWIESAKLHCADLINGQIDHETKKVVDTMAMDDVELKRVITIVEKLSEGNKDENFDTGQ